MQLKQRIDNANIILSQQVYDNIDLFMDQLLRWNTIHNLTGATTIEAVQEHVYDSIYPMSFLPVVHTVLDIGTGAGFPGLVMAMAMKKTHFTLVEPLKKRVAFLTFMVATLKLDNVTILPMRVEHIPIHVFDMITSRAVTHTEKLLELSQPFVRKGTILLYFKGERVYDEVSDAYDYEIIHATHRNYLMIKR